MSHYDCSKCGVFGCMEACTDEESDTLVQEVKLSRARALLADELKRRSEMHEAREILMDAGVYEPNEYDVLFD